MDANRIAELLLCHICHRLPDDPVVVDGCIYERKAIEDSDRKIPSTLHSSSQIKSVIKLLTDSGGVDGKYTKEKDVVESEKEKLDATMVDGGFSVIQSRAEQGDSCAMVELGEIYLGNIKNKEEAFRWFDLASDEENALGVARKADCLLTGVGVAKDLKGGRRLLFEAAKGDRSGECTD